MHNASKVLMGATNSTNKTVTSKAGSIEAGVAVRLKSDGTLSVAAADGQLLGISLGVDQSKTGFTAIVRKGVAVPIRLKSGFTPTVGAQVKINDTTGYASGDGSGETAVNAVYVSGKITGVKESDQSSIDVALIDFAGGL